jgi:hypothetical protein
MMKKSHLMIFIAGGLVAAGMVISYTGSSMISQGVSISEGQSSVSAPIEVTRELDPAISDTGVFVVHTTAQGGKMTARVFDPFGSQIVAKEIDSDSTEEQFRVTNRGEHRLVLENSDLQEVRALVGLAHMPDKSVIALNIFGQAAILCGFVGVGIAVIYAAKTRKRTS